MLQGNELGSLNFSRFFFEVALQRGKEEVQNLKPKFEVFSHQTSANLSKRQLAKTD